MKETKGGNMKSVNKENLGVSLMPAILRKIAFIEKTCYESLNDEQRKFVNEKLWELKREVEIFMEENQEGY